MNQDNNSISDDGKNNDDHDNVSNVNEEIGNVSSMNVDAEKDGNSNDADNVSKELSNMNDGDNVNTEKDNNNDDNGDDDVSKELSNMMSISRSKKKRGACLYCLQVVKGSMRCTRCETALYCGRECQVKHWPVHKNSCEDSNDSGDSDKKLQKKAENYLNQGNGIYIYSRLSLLTL